MNPKDALPHREIDDPPADLGHRCGEAGRPVRVVVIRGLLGANVASDRGRNSKSGVSAQNREGVIRLHPEGPIPRRVGCVEPSTSRLPPRWWKAGAVPIASSSTAFRVQVFCASPNGSPAAHLLRLGCCVSKESWFHLSRNTTISGTISAQRAHACNRQTAADRNAG